MTGERVFETARLRVRKITADDVDAMVAVYGDAQAMRWVGDGRALARDDCVRWVEVSEHNYALRGYGMFAAEIRGSPRVIGFGGLVHPGGQPDAELKYALQRSAWGEGYGTELARGLLDYAGKMLGLPRVIATVAPGNEASLRVLEKAGMRPVGLRHDDEGSVTQVFEWRVDAAAS